MHIHCILHADFEKLGVIEDWAFSRDVRLSLTRSDLSEPFPHPSAFEILVLLGGPQSACELQRYSYLQREVELIRQSIQAQRSILGICLGAQILGEALGASACKSPEREVGFFEVTCLAAADQDPVFSKFPPRFNAIHWHNDMPSIPVGGRLLAESKGCPHQAFAYGDRNYGLQFHLEMKQSNLQEMVRAVPSDLTPGRYIESKEMLLAHDLGEMHRLLFLLLDHLKACQTH